MNDLKATVSGFKNLSGYTCKEVLDAVILAYGRSEFDYYAAKIRKQRLDNADSRQARKKFSWGVYKRLYARQRGICRWCDKDMKLIRGEIEADHINPNAEDFNNESNLQVLHSTCNQSKNAMSIAEQSKATGKGYVELLGGFSPPEG